MNEPLFTSAVTFLLRTPLVGKTRALGLPPSELVEDALLREAIAVSSPSLAHRLQSIASGEPASPRIRGKALSSALRYQIRMATRSTPYGLMAGVAVGRFSEGAYATLGREHRKRVKPDGGWLHRQLKERLRSDELGRRDLRVVVNNSCSVRAGRLLAPVTVNGEKTVRSSVRCSPVVEAVLRLAARPVTATELHRALVEAFPQAGAEKVWSFLKSLLDLEILLGDAFPPPWHENPLAYALDRDPGWERGRQWARLAEAYRIRPVGEGYEELKALHEASGPEPGVQVDLAVDAEVRLPPAVAREAERAATVLWRLSSGDGPATRAMRAYHAEFCERYSAGERVPVTRLLDPDAGLGAPAGYTLPGGHRTVPPAPEPETGRERVLHRLFTQALTAGRRHIDLGEEDVAALAYEQGELPASVDLFASVVADSAEAMERGAFVLVLSPVGGGREAGAVWGRFAHLLDAGETLTELRRSAPLGTSQVLPVQLFHATPATRQSNVTGIPQVADAHLCVGLYEDPDVPGTVWLGDVMVSADQDGFHLWDDASGREIAPFTAHVLNPSQTPDVARFLREAPAMTTRPVAGWQWGSLAASPFLPGVRYGRTVLYPTSWRLEEGAFSSPGGDEAEALETWRRRWNVPDRVRLVEGDQFVALDLRLAGHRALLCEEARKTECLLHEDLTLERDEGWLEGPDGAHEAEIVIPLHAKQPIASTRRSRPSTPAPRRTAELRHPPGGEWISAHLYGSAGAQQDILHTIVRPWVAGLGERIDRWFFIRYADEATGRPHLRLRLHGEPGTLSADVLPRLGTWTRDLLAEGVFNDVALRTYAPEAERYGGTGFIAEAEGFFHADSRLVLDRLEGTSDALVVATDLTALVHHFLRDSGEDPAEWLTRNYPKHPALHRGYVARRPEARALTAAGNQAPGATSEALEDWAERLVRFGSGLRKAAAAEPWLDPSAVLRALLHMHCNRRLAPSLEEERRIYAFARGTAEDELNRRRRSSSRRE
ncbi:MULTISPECIES: lantibiotic dehydratase [Streptomyces]|uniref:lantibiotic dehydratase n=1 Tax=Streptomyces TaxID=1883 RepID=UPI0023DD61BF|nr:lantibiotic dehydratase [Streptomyces sp. FXJ1.172]WEP00538.1 lantibiotic dehydratase [Streptomyces sp. FXJ1.172]